MHSCKKFYRPIRNFVHACKVLFFQECTSSNYQRHLKTHFICSENIHRANFIAYTIKSFVSKVLTEGWGNITINYWTVSCSVDLLKWTYSHLQYEHSALLSRDAHQQAPEQRNELETWSFIVFVICCIRSNSLGISPLFRVISRVWPHHKNFSADRPILSAAEM